jgi:hypothetical protein
VKVRQEKPHEFDDVTEVCCSPGIDRRSIVTNDRDFRNGAYEKSVERNAMTKPVRKTDRRAA